MKTKTIEVYNLGGLPVAPLDNFYELQEDFKISDPDKLSKLQMLILSRGFKYSFKAWKDDAGKLWIIDAHQRRKALIALSKAGFDIPPIPYEPIQCSTKQEAVEEIAAYNSEFAKKNPDTVLFEKYEISSDVLNRFNLPFEAKPFDIDKEPISFDFENVDGKDVKEDAFDTDVSLEARVFAQKGDIWLLGAQRLMCGDCRESSDVKKLMNGHLADLCVTDPPYNVDYSGGTSDELTIRNDSMENDLFAVFLRQVFGMMFSVMNPGASFYVFHADSEGENFRASLRKSGFYIAQCCVWVKNSMVMGRQDFQWKHEPILYGWKSGAAHKWYSDRKQTTVWEFDRPTRNGIHPTMKPIAIMAYAICNSSKPQDVVIDFFSGSGSTIMACQQVDRRGYAMEIDPVYVSATVGRYMAMFPEQVVLLERDGKRFTREETLTIIQNGKVTG